MFEVVKQWLTDNGIWAEARAIQLKNRLQARLIDRPPP